MARTYGLDDDTTLDGEDGIGYDDRLTMEDAWERLAARLGFEWNDVNWDLDDDADEIEEEWRRAHARRAGSLRDSDRRAYNRRQQTYRMAGERTVTEPWRLDGRDADDEPWVCGGEERRRYPGTRYASMQSAATFIAKAGGGNDTANVEGKLRARPIWQVADDLNFAWRYDRNHPPDSTDTPSELRQAGWIDAKDVGWRKLQAAATTGCSRDRYQRMDRELERIERRCGPDMAEACLDWVLARFPDFQQWAVARQEGYGRRGRRATKPQLELVATQPVRPAGAAWTDAEGIPYEEPELAMAEALQREGFLEGEFFLPSRWLGLVALAYWLNWLTLRNRVMDERVAA